MRKTVTALLFCCACAPAQNTSAVAIRNARIITVSGPPIAKGTVVIRNGLIEAVGDNITVPADAWIVDGEGLTVYPGLIDSLSTWGMPGTANVITTTGRGGRAGQPATPTPAPIPLTTPERARGPEDRPATTSWLLAADEIQPADP